MRITLLSQWYPPEPVLLPHQWAIDLTLRGHSVHAITGFPNYPKGKLYAGYRLRIHQREVIDCVNVLRLPLFPNHDAGGLKRALNYLSFSASTALLGPIMTESADVMWVFDSLLAGLGAVSISRLRRIPFIYCVQDLWPETLTTTGTVTSQVGVRLISRIADFVYHRASAITVISAGFKANLVQKGVPKEKIHVIPNWADESIYRPVPRDETLADQYDLHGRFNVIYGGNLGTAQALANVLDAANILLSEIPDIQFVLIGDGVESELLKTKAKVDGTHNVRFIDHQPASRIPAFFALADVLLVHLKRSPLFEITIPSKIVSYMACEKPILAAVMGDAANVITQAGAGLTCLAEDPISLANAVRQLYGMSLDERHSMGVRGRDEFLRRYSRSVVMDAYETVLKDVAEAVQRN